MTNFHYTWVCEPSAERRGYRPTHSNGCGRMNVYSHKNEIKGRYSPQASPCKNCRNRKRLNEGNTEEWFDRKDAVHHASEYNERHFNAVSYSEGEENTEQMYEQEVSNE